jgi:hypothetical protein
MRLLLPALLSLGLSAQAPTHLPTHLVVRPVVTLYSGPSAEKDIVTQALLGEKVVVLEEKEGFARLRCEDAYEGWAPLAALRKPAAGEAPYATQGRVARVEALMANLYREPDVTKHEPLLVAPYGVRLEIVGDRKDDRWLEARLPSGAKAWIQVGDVTEDLRPLEMDASISLAKRFLGVPYLWGGGSAQGLDCSGFTQLVVRARGTIMPRDADQQAAWSGVTDVQPDHLRAGDLLFFGSSMKAITHTGMYLGEGRFIHATTHDHPVVQISHLGDEPWKRLLVCCRRVK